MKYGSVCSGIEAASVAWESLGWQAQWYSEIEHFPSAVLAHRFPTVPNLGDMTKIHETEIFNGNSIDLLVGGTPCQSFSVAGLRKGLADPRGNLMLTFLSLAQRKKPRWIVWENVPGVLSSNGGGDFGTFLQALAECGYGFAYRILDAQYFGVAQRRRRVFVVGYLGDWRPAGAVLFEQDCLSGNTKKSREKRKATSSDAQGGIGDRGQSTGVNPDLMATLCAKDNEKWGCNQWVNEGKAIVEPKPSWWNGEQTAATLTAQPIPIHDQATRHSGKRGENQDGKGNGLGIGNPGDPMNTLTKGDHHAVAQPIAVDTYNQTINEHSVQTIRSDGNHTDRTGAVLTPAKSAGFIPKNGAKARSIGYTEEQTPTLDTGCSNFGVVQSPIAVDTYNYTTNERTTQTIRSQNDTEHIEAVLQPTMAIRRLTPTECERLQGFPDGWTKIPYRNKPEEVCPDGPRYKACGNSMAVPVMRWIGQRIEMVEELLKEIS
jgi:DNA (cytosine-5)-methyltransferase 1